MKRSLIVLLLVVSMAAAGCSTPTSTPTTLGVDDAPAVIKNTYLTVARQASTLAGLDIDNEQWIAFARDLCAARLGSRDELAEYVVDRAGPDADQVERQMWSTAAGAATSSFCPIGRA
jgi:hypothetical protein